MLLIKKLNYSFYILALPIFVYTSQYNIKLINKNEFTQDIEVQLKNISLCAFEIVYKKIWDQQFKENGLKNLDKLILDYKNSKDNMFWIVAQNENLIVGWALFIKDNEKNRVIIEQISVDPIYQRQYLGKQLVFSIKYFWPEVKTILVASRKINEISPLFYQSLGFVNSDFMLEKYLAKDMLGYEFNYLD